MARPLDPYGLRYGKRFGESRGGADGLHAPFGVEQVLGQHFRQVQRVPMNVLRACITATDLSTMLRS